MEHLFEKLRQYAEGDIYPYHMPGHKRRPCGELPEEMYRADITEIDGFDDLHRPEGILLELQQRAARLYGAEESHYLINGSTGGILCAVSSALPFGGHILMARNCHRSVYHGAYLRNLKISYLWPPYLEAYDICDAVTPKQVQAALEKEISVGAVMIVSPTYEGRIADVGAIAEVVHRRGIPLIVDEAHGAHLGLAEGFAPNSCQSGADLVIHSVHKTLPALTQTALLHVSGSRVDRRMLRRFLDIYQSSSPSYLLMAGIDNALQYVETQGRNAFRGFREQYEKMTECLSKCRYLRFPKDGQDIGKLLISVKGTGLAGKELYDLLLEKYHLQLEMAAGTFALAMFTVNDGAEAYERMTEALLEIDDKLSNKKIAMLSGETEAADEEKQEEESLGKLPMERIEESQGKLPMERIEENLGKLPMESDCAEAEKGQKKEEFRLAAAWDMPAERVLLRESVGRRAGDFINLYPPGTPLLVPGERMTEDLCRLLQKALEQGLTVQGVETGEGKADGENVYVRVMA